MQLWNRNLAEQLYISIYTKRSEAIELILKPLSVLNKTREQSKGDISDLFAAECAFSFITFS